MTRLRCAVTGFFLPGLLVQRAVWGSKRLTNAPFKAQPFLDALGIVAADIKRLPLVYACVAPVPAGGSPFHTKVQRPGRHQQLRRLRRGGNPRFFSGKVRKGVCRVLGCENMDISGKKGGSLHSSKDLGWSRDHHFSDVLHSLFIP